MQFDHVLSRQVEQVRRLIYRDHLRAALAAAHRNRNAADEIGEMLRRVLVEESLLRDAVGKPPQGQRPVFHVGQQAGRDALEVIRQAGLADTRKQLLVGVGDVDVSGAHGA